MICKAKINKTVKNKIDEKLFGNFIEHIENCILGGIWDGGNPLSDENGIRQDVLAKCKELNPPIVRFPGGTVMGIYHWQDHVGPVNNRKKMSNLIWGDRLCHEFGTAEFVNYCRKIGAEPMICVNMPTGTAEEAAHWVEYCNGTEDTYYANLRRSHGYEEPFNVKYWCIGNESYAEPDLGWQHDCDIYIREAWEYTKYMKLTDPSIKLVFVGYTQEWNKNVLDSLYSMCDYLSVHYYSPNYDFSFALQFEKDVLIPTEKLLDEYNKKEIKNSTWYRIPARADKIKIALDEWNIWNPNSTEKSKYGLAQEYTWNEALWTARFMNMMLRHSAFIGIANMAQMVNVIAPIMADKDGSFVQTTFYPIKNYRKDCGSGLISVDYDDSELDLCATLCDGGECIVFAVNTSEKQKEVDFGEKISSIKLITCGDINAINTMHNNFVKEIELKPDGVIASLPAYSIAIIRL